MSKYLSFKSKRTPMQNNLIALFSFFAMTILLGIIPTQWFAAKHGFDPNLGEEVFHIGRLYVYLPTDWISWSWRYADVSTLKTSAHIMNIMGFSTIVVGGVLSIFVALFLAKGHKGMENLHGSARWAERADLQKLGFLSDKNYKAKGPIIGSVVYDKKGKIITPHHKDYAERYEPVPVKLSFFKKLFSILSEPEYERNSEGKVLTRINKRKASNIEIIRDSSNTHIFGFAPTRSGKGVGLVLPTAFTWEGSMMFNDIKGELYALTAGFRKYAGNKVIKFEPGAGDGSSAAYNPLDEIRIFTSNDVKDAQMIMSMICDPKGEGLEDYFDKAAYEFLFCVSLHVAYSGKEGSIPGMANFLGDPSWDSDSQIYTYMMQYQHDPEGKMGWRDSSNQPTKVHPVIANGAKTMMNKEDKDRSGVLSTAKTHLSLFLDPVIAKNTSHSDFLMRDIMTNDTPVSLYLVIQPTDMDRMIPLQRLFYALFIRRNAQDMKFEDGKTKKSYTHSLLMVLDEMASLRKLPIIQEALGYVAGYGIRMMMIVQDIAQIEELYSDKQSIDSGAATRIAYGPNKIETAQKLAQLAGKTTVHIEKISFSKDIASLKTGSMSSNVDAVERDLMTADEFMSLHDNDMVIFRKGQPPIYGRISFFYENDELLRRSKIVAPAKSDFLRKREITEISESTPLSTSNSVNEANTPPLEKWQEERKKTQQQLNALLNDDPIVVNNPVDKASKKPSEGTGASSGKRNRYMGKDVTLSEEERSDIIAMTQDISLYERVVAMSTFD